MQRGLRFLTLSACLLVQTAIAHAQTNVTITPQDQPQDGAPAATMKLYADMNARLAAALEDPQSACLKAYAAYDSCKASGSVRCGARPACSATFVLPAMDMTGLRLRFSSDDAAATVTPQELAPQPLPSGGEPAPTEKAPKDIQSIRSEPGSSPAPVIGVAGMSGGVMGGMAGAAPPVANPRFSGPARVSGAVMSGNVINKVAPVYPFLAKVAHLSGTVVMKALITKEGRVQDLVVLSSTSPLFNAPAITAVRQWRYRPYTLNGEPTDVTTTVTVNFTLQ